MSKATRARIFWSGGSQAVRLPKALRLPGTEVSIHRRGASLVLEPVSEGDDWVGFWDQLRVLAHPVKRHPTRPAERRRPL
jgi:virulence-associated protein VagC